MLKIPVAMTRAVSDVPRCITTIEQFDIALAHFRVLATLEMPNRPRGVAIIAPPGADELGWDARLRSLTAQFLRRVGVATLAIDSQLRPDLVGSGMANLARWARHAPATRKMPIGYFGAGSAADAVLTAAAVSVAAFVAIAGDSARYAAMEERVARTTSPLLRIVVTLRTDALEGAAGRLADWIDHVMSDPVRCTRHTAAVFA